MAPHTRPAEAFKLAYEIILGAENMSNDAKSTRDRVKSIFIHGKQGRHVAVLDAMYLYLTKMERSTDPIRDMKEIFSRSKKGKSIVNQAVKWKWDGDTLPDEYRDFDIARWIKSDDGEENDVMEEEKEMDDDGGEGDDDDEDEGDVDDQADDDDEVPPHIIPDYQGKGTGKFNNIPDEVLENETIYPGLVFNDLEREQIDLPKAKKPSVDEKHNLDPADYELVELVEPIQKSRPPYTPDELGIKLTDQVWAKFGFSKHINDTRETKVQQLYYRLDLTVPVRDAEEVKYTHMYTHKKIGLHATWKNVEQWRQPLLPFLYALAGFSEQQVDDIWRNEDGTLKRFFRNGDAMKSKLLSLYFEEARAYGPDAQYRGSPTLMYSLLKYAAVNGRPCRETKPRNALDILLIQEIAEKLQEVVVMMRDPALRAKDNKVRTRITYIQNLGFVASLIYEVVAGTSVQLTGWHQLIQLIVDSDDIRTRLSRAYGRSDGEKEDVGRAVIGLYLIMSRDKKIDKAQSGQDRELSANQKPVVFNTTKMKAFSNKLVDIIQSGGKDAWKAACLCVEMHTGARITEVLGYAEFESFGEMRARDPDQARVLLQDIRQKTQNSFSLDGLDDSIIQQGVLKRKSNRQRIQKRSDISFVDETLPPKPVIMGLTAFDIKKALFVARRYVYEYMTQKYGPDSSSRSFDQGKRLRDLPPPLFKPLVGQINSYLAKVFIDGAIVGYQAHAVAERGEKKVTTHVLRRFYANYSFEHHAVGMVRNVWIMSVLGHDAKGLATSLSYTNATMQDPLAHIPIPQKAESLGVLTYNALQDVKDEIANHFRELVSGGSVRQGDLQPLRKRRRRNEIDEDDDDSLVAVLVDAPATIRRVMPGRIESRTTDDRQKADVVRDYVEKNFRFEHEGHTYLCKPTQTNLMKKGHFGHSYAHAFVTLEKEMADKWSAEYDKIVEGFLV